MSSPVDLCRADMVLTEARSVLNGRMAGIGEAQILDPHAQVTAATDEAWR